MRHHLFGLAALIVVPSAAAQAGAVSSAVQVTLVARKLASVGLLPTGTEASQAALPPNATGSPDAARADRLGVTTHWNLSPEQVGDLRLRTARTASRDGAAYIERRVLLTDPVARLRHALAVAPPVAASVDSLVMVRLVVY